MALLSRSYSRFFSIAFLFVANCVVAQGVSTNIQPVAAIPIVPPGLPAPGSAPRIDEFTVKEFTDAVINNDPELVFTILDSVKKGKTGSKIINEPYGKFGRTALHEMADRDWALHGDETHEQRMKAIDAIIALGADLMQRETKGGKHTPREISDARGKGSTELYLRAKEMEQGKGKPASGEDLWEAVDRGEGHEALMMIKLVEKGILPKTVVNEVHGKWGRALLHAMANQDWALHGKSDSEQKMESLEKVIALGGDLMQRETQGGKHTPREVADAQGKGSTELYLRAKEMQQGKGAPATGKDIWEAVVRNEGHEALMMLKLIEEGKLPKEVVNERNGSWGRALLHEMATRDWAYTGESDSPQRIEALKKVIEFGGDLMQRETSGGKHTPSEIAKADDKQSTYWYLRGQEILQEKGEPFTAREIWKISHRAREQHVEEVLLKMLRAVEAGALPREVINERFGKLGRNVLHEIAARDWGNPEGDTAKVRIETLRKLLELGADINLAEEKGGQLTPIQIAAGDHPHTVDILRAAEIDRNLFDSWWYREKYRDKGGFEKEMIEAALDDLMFTPIALLNAYRRGALKLDLAKLVNGTTALHCMAHKEWGTPNLFLNSGMVRKDRPPQEDDKKYFALDWIRKGDKMPEEIEISTRFVGWPLRQLFRYLSAEKKAELTDKYALDRQRAMQLYLLLAPETLGIINSDGETPYLEAADRENDTEDNKGDIAAVVAGSAAAAWLTLGIGSAAIAATSALAIRWRHPHAYALVTKVYFSGLWPDARARFNFVTGKLSTDEETGEISVEDEILKDAYPYDIVPYVVPIDGNFYTSEPAALFSFPKPSAIISKDRDDVVQAASRDDHSLDSMWPMPAYGYSLEDQSVLQKKGAEMRASYRWKPMAAADATAIFTAKDGKYPVLMVREQPTRMPQQFLSMSVPTYHVVPGNFYEGNGHYLKKGTYYPAEGILEVETGVRGEDAVKKERIYIGSLDALIAFNQERVTGVEGLTLRYAPLPELINLNWSNKLLRKSVTVVPAGDTPLCDLFKQIATMDLTLPQVDGKPFGQEAGVTITPVAGSVAVIVRGVLDGKHTYNVLPAYRVGALAAPLKQLRYYPQDGAVVLEDLNGLRTRYQVGTIDRIIAALVDGEAKLTVQPLTQLVRMAPGLLSAPESERYLTLQPNDYEGAMAVTCDEQAVIVDEQRGIELIQAIAQNRRDDVEHLLCDPKTDFNAVDPASGNTALHEAVRASWPERDGGEFWQRYAVRQLIERGANMHKKRASDNKSALEEARDKGNENAVRFLTDCALMLGEYLVTAIHRAKGDKADQWLIEKLLDNPNTDVNAFSMEKDYYADTPLAAVMKRNWPTDSIAWQQKLVERLLARGADPRLKRPVDGMTPLNFGSEHSRNVVKGMVARYKDRVAPTMRAVVAEKKTMLAAAVLGSLIVEAVPEPAPQQIAPVPQLAQQQIPVQQMPVMQQPAMPNVSTQVPMMPAEQSVAPTTQPMEQSAVPGDISTQQIGIGINQAPAEAQARVKQASVKVGFAGNERGGQWRRFGSWQFATC